MAQLENTLGAPTEGLGQTVTFTANQPGGVSQAQAGQRGGVNNSLQGGEARTSTKAQYIPNQENKTLSMLYKLGSDVLAPHIEQAQTEQFIKGMQQVATGQAINEVVDDQPWYSKVFGNTSLVDGAKAYSTYAKVQEASIAFQAAMPELRKKSSAEMSAWYANSIAGVKTGDAGTDAMVMQHMAKEMPTMMAHQTKEHIVWQNEQYAKSWQAGASAGASNLQSMLVPQVGNSRDVNALLADNTGSTLTEADRQRAKVSYTQVLAKPAAMPQETYDKLLPNFLHADLQRGNLHSFTVAEQAGFLDSMTPQAQESLQKARAMAENKVRQSMPQWAIEEDSSIRALVANLTTPQQLDEARSRINKLNADWIRIKGTQEGIFPPLAEATLLANAKGNLYQEDAARRREAQKLIDKQTTELGKKQAEEVLITNNMNDLLAGKGSTATLSGEDLSNAYRLADAMGTGNQARIASFNYGKLDKIYEGKITTELNAKGSNPVEFDRIYRDHYLPLITRSLDGSENQVAAQAYFNGNESNGRAMAAYHAQVGGRAINNPQELGGNHAFAIQQSGPPPTTDPSGALTGNSKLYADSIAERISSKNSIFNLSDDVASAQRLQALNYLSPIANRMSNTMTPQERMTVAIATAEKQGTTFLGGMLMRTPVGAKPMEDTLLAIADDKGRPLITPDEVHAAFALSINQWVNATGAKNVTALHTADGDKSIVQMIGWDNKKSVLVSYVVTPDEIAKNWHDYHNQPAAIVLPDIRRRKAYVADANKPTK